MTATTYRYSLFGIGFLCLLGLLLALGRGVPVMAAGDRYVNPAGSDSGDCANVATPCLTIAYAVAQATAGDTIHLAAGAYTGPGNQHVIISKALTLAGAGADTILTYDPLTEWTLGGRLGILEIRTSDVTVRDLTIRDVPIEGGVPLWGVQVWKSGSTVANATFDTVHFLNNAGRGIELHNDTTIVDLVVRHSLFEDNAAHGIRSASTARIDGFTITDTIFRNNGQSAYTQSAGSAGYLSGLRIDGGTFEGNAVHALQLGNVYDAIIEHSTFSGGGRGILFVTAAAGADPIGQVTIRNNVLTDLGDAAILVDITNTALDAPLVIEGNSVNQAVDLLGIAGATFDVGLAAGQTHAAITVDNNAITHSGALGAATAAHALKLSGGLTNVTITDNQFDGGGVANNGGEPANSGVYLASNSTQFGAIAAGDAVELTTNTISGFVNGVTVYDEVGGVFGGLPAANGLALVRNSIAGNSAFGVRSGPANAAAAICNWWGAATGPSGVGPGAGDAVSSHVLFAPWLASSDLAGSLCGSVNDIFVGTNSHGQVAGIPFTDVDVMALDRDTGTWSKFFEGEDVNVSTNLTGFTFEPGGCLLVSFDGNEKKLGLGFIKPNDILKFCPTSLGETTTGTWSVYFDGSDVGLAAKSENLDALELLPDGRLLLSTKGSFSVKDAANNTLAGRDEDILVFDPTTLGANTAGTFALYLDGSDVPGLVKEDVGGIYYNPLNGDLHISIPGSFNVGGVAGSSSDIIILRPSGGGYAVLPYWHGPDDGWSYALRSMHIDLP